MTLFTWKMQKVNFQIWNTYINKKVTSLEGLLEAVTDFFVNCGIIWSLPHSSHPPLALIFSRFCFLYCNFFFQPFTLLSRPSIWASPTALPTLWERCTTLAPSPSPTFYSATPMNRKRNGTSLQRWHSQRMGWSTSRPTWQRTCPPKSFTREKLKNRLKVKKANRK